MPILLTRPNLRSPRPWDPTQSRDVRSGTCAAKLMCSYCGGVYVCGGGWTESLLLGSLELKGCEVQLV